MRIGRTGRNPMTVITILQMPAGFLHCDIVPFHLSAAACTEPARSPLVRRSELCDSLEKLGRRRALGSAAVSVSSLTTPRFWMVSSGHSARFVCSGQAGIASRLSCSRVSTAGP